MKRDMDLVREILLYLEENYEDVALYNITIDNYDFKTIAYHCKLCYDGGLISDYDSAYGDDGISDFGIGSLTWKGHEFLEKVRDDTIWNKTKTTMKE